MPARIRFGLEIHGEAGGSHAQVVQFGFDGLAHLTGGFLALLGELEGLLGEFCQRSSFGGFQFSDAFGCGGDGLELLAGIGGESDDGFDGAAIFALQAADQVEAFLDLLQPLGVEFDGFEVVAQAAGQVGQVFLQRGGLVRPRDPVPGRSGPVWSSAWTTWPIRSVEAGIRGCPRPGR